MKAYILWDHDGVLVDTEPWYFEATRLCIAELGVDLQKPEYLKDMAAGRPAWDRARARGIPEERIAAVRAKRNELYQQYLVDKDIEVPGVIDVLSRLAERCTMAIVTTAKRQDLELIHRDRRILQFMDFVIANGDYTRSKPHPEPYLLALERFGAHPGNTLVVEDSERGLRSAVSAGLDCVVVEHPFVAGQDFSLATRSVASIQELPDLLDAW